MKRADVHGTGVATGHPAGQGRIAPATASSRLAKLCLAAVVLATVSVPACKRKPPDEPVSHTVQRTDFAPEEFGIGRPHTRDRLCNRDIDQLLDETRRCYNNPPPGGCERLQEANAAKIGRLKNSERCAR